VTWISTSSGDISTSTNPDGPHTIVATTRDTNGSADSVLLEINVVPGFEGWAADRSLPATPLFDHNFDGLTLLEEYGFMIDPLDGASSSPVAANPDDGAISPAPAQPRRSIMNLAHEWRSPITATSAFA
jgi:hypothetical protein